MYKHIRPWAWWYKSLMLRKPLHKMRDQTTSIPLFVTVFQQVVRTPSASYVLDQDALFDEILDISICRILRALRKFRPLRRREFSFESIEAFVQDEPLSVVYHRATMCLPEPRLTKYRRERRF